MADEEKEKEEHPWAGKTPTEEELKKILADHAAWYEAGMEGKPPHDLTGVVLREANLEGAKLWWANLEGAFLLYANFNGADLNRANLREARCYKTDLGEANVSDARMQGAYLAEANLSGAKGLVARNLAGADLTGAILPESVNKFRIADSVALTARHARKLFAPLLLSAIGVAYLAFTPPSDSSGYQIPLLNIKVPEARFALLSPLVLLVWNCFFLRYLGRLWYGLASLPAVFPEGVALTHHPDSWFPITIIRLRLERLGGWDGKVLGALAALLVWGLFPFLLFLMACGFSRLDNHVVNLATTSSFVLALGLSLHGFRKAMIELTAAYNDSVKKTRRRSAWALGIFLFLLLLVLYFAWPSWLKLLALVRVWIMSSLAS